MPWLDFFFSFKGRLSPADDWLRSTLAMLLFFVSAAFMLFVFFALYIAPARSVADHHGGNYGWAALLFFIIADFAIYLRALLAIAARRCHDPGFSGNQMFARRLTSLPLSFKRGVSGPNAFRPDPLRAKLP